MAGPYFKGKDFPDREWKWFLDDVSDGEMDVPGGISADRFRDMPVDHGTVTAADPELCREMRKYLSVVLKRYRDSSGAEHEAVTELLRAHGKYCKGMGTAKWRRVHNVLAYRYADKDLFTCRMIGRKLGKGKEEIDNDIMEGQRNLVKLSCGYPAIADKAEDTYSTVFNLLCNYMLLDSSRHLDVSGLFPEEWQQEIIRMQGETEQLMECFDTAVRLYGIFCRGSGETEIRRLAVLQARFIEKRMPAAQLAKQLNIGLSTVQNDCRINIKRLSGIMFKS